MSDDPAAARFAVIQLVRVTGLILTLFGLAVVFGRTGLPVVAGYVLTVAGLIDFFVITKLLARRWKSPEP